MAERTEKMLIERELKSKEIRKLAEEHYGYKEDNYNLQNLLATLQYEHAVSIKQSL